MTGEAVVVINSSQWSVEVATTPAELTQGLSGVTGMPAGTGMLFDLGFDQSYIQIDMSRMLFALDIIFINSSRGVVGVLHNVQPSDEAYLDNSILPGARWFLEVNAGESEGIDVGDDVVIQGDIQPAFWQYVGAALLLLPVIMPMFSSVAKELEGEP